MEIAAAARAVRARRPWSTSRPTRAMSRGGAPWPHVPGLLRVGGAAAGRGARSMLVGLWSHLRAVPDLPGSTASSTCRSTPTRGALKLCRAGVCRALPGDQAPRQLRGDPDSAAPPLRLVRPGIAMYGLSPIPEQGDFACGPAMTLAARVALAKRVPEWSVGLYGHLYTTTEETYARPGPSRLRRRHPQERHWRVEVMAGGTRRPVVAGSAPGPVHDRRGWRPPGRRRRGRPVRALILDGEPILSGMAAILGATITHEPS
ncbi:hypothetical protein [Nonomuraea dietziae]|uniref:hypothetical protein n=1 Tax=Nonomuraea dietziae TaxID=65515 RepID=UPI0031D63B82